MFWNRSKRKKVKAENLFLEGFNESINTYNLVFVFFKADWCGACKILKPLVDELADENREKDLMIANVDVGIQKELSHQYEITRLPTLLVFRDKELIFKGPGMISKPRLQEMIDNLLESKK